VPVQNSQVADIFNKAEALLELKNENQFRVWTYREAARTVGGRSRSVAKMVQSKMRT
jgi:DNA polymerase/3'-5' exonuclease PolX